ncbi:hypothetical protein I3760_10G050700 [Carya illinoinensis]|nr:hypothetical protein I3760_10G050700 [Carya illinoinensis]
MRQILQLKPMRILTCFLHVDVSRDMEFEGHDRQLRSSSYTLEKSEVKISSDYIAVEESNGNSKFSSHSNEPLTTQKEELDLNYEDSKYKEMGKDMVSEDKVFKDCSESHCDSKVFSCTKDIIDVETHLLFSSTRNDMANAFPVKDHLGEEPNGVSNTREEIKQMDLQSGHDKNQMESRLATADTRTRSLSPGAEIKEGNKRPAVICDFFAQGWCIRGSSCRFLHIKDGLNNTTQKSKVEADALNWKKVQVDKGLRDITERSRSPGFPEPQESSVGNTLEFSLHISSETILPRELGESQRWHQFHRKHKLPLVEKEDLSSCSNPDSQHLPSSKDDPVSVSFKDVGGESQRENWPANNYGDHASSNSRGSSLVKNNLLPEYGFSSSSSVLLSRNYHSEIFSSHSLQSQHVHSECNSPLRIHSLNSSSNTHLQSTGMLPSHRTSSWRASSLPFSYSSFSTSSLGVQRLLNSEKECHASESSSLLLSYSPFSGSKSENLPLASVPLHCAEHKTKFSSNDWEPSVPFRPSIFIPPIGISSPDRQYDPLHDSIELPKIGDQSFGVSLDSHGASIMDTLLQRKYGNPALTEMQGLECHNDTTSVSSHNKVYENVLEKHHHGRGSLKTEAETVGTSAVDRKSGMMPKEGNPLGFSHVNDRRKRSKLDDCRPSSHQNDASRHQDLKVGRGGQDNEMDVGHKTDGNIHGEPKALRHFRAALIDLVKELLKPNWRDGHLSKDAHNMIVKKVVDKVLKTLQSHQVPTTLESKQYLSSSRPKIVKLVEGYVEKYGKS